MMSLWFVDTSAWVSMADRSEASHQRVADVLRDRQGALLTTDHILQETWAVMRYRHGRHPADDLVNAIRKGIALLESSSLADLETAAAIAGAFPDQDFSLADRTSWAVMERLGIGQAVSLDRDFRIYRHGPRWNRAFEVVP